MNLLCTYLFEFSLQEPSRSNLQNDQPVAFPLIADPPTPRPSSSIRDPPNLTPEIEEDFSDEELNDLLALSKFNTVCILNVKNFT